MSSHDTFSGTKQFSMIPESSILNRFNRQAGHRPLDQFYFTIIYPNP